MTREASPSSAEKDLYPVLRKLLEQRGYCVEEQFEIYSTLTGAKRKIDVLGFRWSADGDVDAWAVEAKKGGQPGDILKAIAQAIEYQLLVPKVSVAAEVHRDNLSFAEYPLRQLGLGYLCATRQSAGEVIAPSTSPRFYHDEFNHIIRHAGVLRLLIDDLNGDLPREWRVHTSVDRDRDREAAPYCMFAAHIVEDVQIMLRSSFQSRDIVAGVWVEAKPFLKGMVNRIDGVKFHRILNENALTGVIECRERTAYGRLKPVSASRPVGMSEHKTLEAIQWAKSVLKQARTLAVFNIPVELWPWSDAPRRDRATKRAAEALKRLQPVRLYLQTLQK